MNLNIFCDFDGTISRLDTVDFILGRFASKEWEDIERQWNNGEIGSGECMRRQISLINASLQQLDSALDELKIDEAFPDFVKFCDQHDLSLTIVSDGVDYFIRHILSCYKICDLTIIANKLIVSEGCSYELQNLTSSSPCKSMSGVCKCSIVKESKNMLVYVGDGRSDFCVADKAEVVFAKDKLALYCQENNISYIPYMNFADVKMHLQIILSGINRSQTECPHAIV